MTSQPPPGAGAADAAGARPSGAADAAAPPPEGPSPLWLFPLDACGLPPDVAAAVLAELRGKAGQHSKAELHCLATLRLTCRAARDDVDARAASLAVKSGREGGWKGRPAQLQALAARLAALRELQVDAAEPGGERFAAAFVGALPGLTKLELFASIAEYGRSDHEDAVSLLRAIGALPNLRSLDLTSYSAPLEPDGMLAHVLRGGACAQLQVRA